MIQDSATNDLALKRMLNSINVTEKSHNIAQVKRDDEIIYEKYIMMKFQELRVDGGACKNDFLMQFQADILGCPINRSQHIESTGMGAAFLAGLATEFWSSASEIQELRKSDKIFEPLLPEAQREKIYQGWMDAVQRVKSAEN